MSQAARAHLKAAGRRSFKMQAAGWTFAILPLALSMLASDTGSSAGAQPSIQQEEIGGGGEGAGVYGGVRGVTYFHFALGHLEQRLCRDDIWEEKMKSKSALHGARRRRRRTSVEFSVESL